MKETKMQDSERLTMTIPELAKVLGISRSTCYSLAQQNKLPVPVIKLGERRLVVSRRCVDELLSANQ
jgi:excisionase family DNA binding protein